MGRLVSSRCSGGVPGGGVRSTSTSERETVTLINLAPSTAETTTPISLAEYNALRERTRFKALQEQKASSTAATTPQNVIRAAGGRVDWDADGGVAAPSAEGSAGSDDDDDAESDATRSTDAAAFSLAGSVAPSSIATSMAESSLGSPFNLGTIGGVLERIAQGMPPMCPSTQQQQLAQPHTELGRQQHVHRPDVAAQLKPVPAGLVRVVVQVSRGSVGDLGMTVRLSPKRAPVIDSIKRRGPADESGLKLHDEIVGLNGTALKLKDYQNIVSLLPTGPEATFSLIIQRKGADFD